MMGLGYLGSSSSSSSSSNLSPLAPPFTVDRSNHNKPILNSNPVSHFNDPSYGVPHSSPWSYSHSSTARQDFLADSLRTTAVPSNDYGYMIPEPINPPSINNWSGLNSNVKPGAHWSAVNPSPKPVTDSFSYNLTEAKPFYPPYASSVNKDDIPLVSLSEPSYDLLSTSGLVLGDESSQVDYTRTLSELEYNPQREGLWSGLPDGKQGKKMESDDSFFSEEANIAASLAYNDYLKQGVYGAETLSKGKEDSSMFYHADITRRENNIGPSLSGKSDVTSFSGDNHRVNSNEFSKGGPSFRAFPMFSESHPLVPSPDAPQEHWNSQKSYTRYEKRFHMFDCSDDCVSPSVTKSSPLVIKPPAAVSTFSARGTGSSNSFEIGNIAALNINDVVGSHKPLKENEHHLPQGLESQGSFLAPNHLSFRIGRSDDHTTVAPSSTKEDTSTKLSANDRLNFEFKARSSFQLPDINIPNVNTTENVKSTANSFENLDHHNPAEDSPCWKGAPTSHFLPFGSPEAKSPQHPTKKLQTGNCVNLQGYQTDHSFNYSSKVHEVSDCFERRSGPGSLQKEHANSAKANSRGGAQSVHDTIKPSMEHGFLNESTIDANSHTSQSKLSNLEEGVVSPEMKIQPLYGDVDHAIGAAENVLVSSVEDAATLATAKKVDASILVKALHNLSDLLLLHCSNDENAMKEQDRMALDHVIGNLDVCMSGKAQEVSAHKSTFLQPNTSNISQEGAYGGKCQVTDETTDIFYDDQDGQHHAHYQKWNSDIFGENLDKLLEGASLRDEADRPKSHNMVQAIKKVLDENLECKEELPSQTLLFKNLWLEAEAELCSLSYRARFERMKRVVEKGKSEKATVSDACESRPAIKKIPSANVSLQVKKIPLELMQRADGSKVSETHVQNQPLSGVDRQIDDVEASVMARLNILKRRGESNMVNVEEQEVAGEVSGNGSAVQHEASVMARLNILKRRGESNMVNVEEQEVAGEVSGNGSAVQHDICKDEAVVSGNGVEPLVMGRLKILKRRSEVEACGEESGRSKGSHLEDEVEGVANESEWEDIGKDEFCWQRNGRLS